MFIGVSAAKAEGFEFQPEYPQQCFTEPKERRHQRRPRPRLLSLQSPPAIYINRPLHLLQYSKKKSSFTEQNGCRNQRHPRSRLQPLQPPPTRVPPQQRLVRRRRHALAKDNARILSTAAVARRHANRARLDSGPEEATRLAAHGLGRSPFAVVFVLLRLAVRDPHTSCTRSLKSFGNSFSFPSPQKVSCFFSGKYSRSLEDHFIRRNRTPLTNRRRRSPLT